MSRYSYYKRVRNAKLGSFTDAMKSVNMETVIDDNPVSEHETGVRIWCDEERFHDYHLFEMFVDGVLWGINF